MRRAVAAVAAGAALISLAACASSELPPTMLGSFHRTDVAVGGVELTSAQLQITPTGITVTSPEVRQSIDVFGKPVVGQRVGGVPGGAALFEKVRCEVKTTCTFTTKNGCDGSFTLDGEDVVIVATGPCTAWAGKWKHGEGKASITPVEIGSSIASGPHGPPPDGSDPPPGGPPPGGPSAAPSSGTFEQATQCRIRCGDAHASCALKCAAEHACATECMKRYGECREACPPL